MYIFILLLTLAGLYLVNKNIIYQLNMISYLLFKSAKPGIYFYFILFLPGIIIHELAHFFMASILNVPAGDIEIFPRQVKKGKYTLGQIKYAKTDPIRQNLIGIAPIIFGSIIITALVKFVLGSTSLAQIPEIALTLPDLLFLYLILAIVNTMFISQEDRQSILALPIIIALLILFLRAFEQGEILAKAKVIVQNTSQILTFSYLFGLVTSLILFLLFFVISTLVKSFLPKRK